MFGHETGIIFVYVETFSLAVGETVSGRGKGSGVMGLVEEKTVGFVPRVGAVVLGG